MRTITAAEYDFLDRVAKNMNIDLHVLGLSPTAIVEDMADGGMGSLRFHRVADKKTQRRLGGVITQGEFNDEDGVPVSFTINIDEDGKLFELDLWRVDFEPIKRLPH